MPLLLSELSGLQGKALSQLETPPAPDRPGFCSACLAIAKPKKRQGRRARSKPKRLRQYQRRHQPTLNLMSSPHRRQQANRLRTGQRRAAVATGRGKPSTTCSATAGRIAVVSVPHCHRDGARTTPELKPPSNLGPAACATSPPAINPDELIHPGDAPAPLLLDSLPLPTPIAQALAAIDPEQSEHDILYALPDSPEPSYSSVAKHIEDTLLGPARRPDAA
jgi:diguanylate cyclase